MSEGSPRGEAAAASGGDGRLGLAARLASSALGAVAVLFAVRTVIVIWREWPQPNYVMPVAVVIAAALCAGLTVTGAWLTTRRSDWARSWLTVLTSLLFLWGCLTMFSIGLGLVIAAVACLLVRVRIEARRPVSPWRPRARAGFLLSLGLVPLSALAISGPVVECIPGGVQSGIPVWTWFGTASGSRVDASGEVTPSSQQSSGQVTVGGTTYRYTCIDDRLTKFMPG